MGRKDLMPERAAVEDSPHRQQRNGHLNYGPVLAPTQEARNDHSEEIDAPDLKILVY